MNYEQYYFPYRYLGWGPWARCIMANNAVNVLALSCRIIPIWAGLNQSYKPGAKLLNTPLVKANLPACRLTLKKHLKAAVLSYCDFCSRSLTEQPSSGIASNPLMSFTESAHSNTRI